MSALLKARKPSAKYVVKREAQLVRHFELLATAPGGVARLRQLILSLAVQGKLVPQDASDEPASALLEKIQADGRRQITQGKFARDRWNNTIAPEEKPFALAQHWQWARLGSLAAFENGDRGSNYPSRSNFVNEGIAFINAGHLLNGRVDCSELNYITSQTFNSLRSGKIQKDDILYCLRGSLGKFALVDNEMLGAISSSLVIIRLSKQLSVSYAMLYLASPLASALIRRFDNGTAQPNLGAGDLARFVVPVPPLAEQTRIVARVEELMPLCDALDAKGRLEAAQHSQLVTALLGTLTDSASPEALADRWQRIAEHFDILLDRPEAIDALEQTILQLAIRGLLVRQDPDDEPASVLLEKIRMEKEQLVSERKLKRAKSFALATDKEQPFKLPARWSWARLGTITDTRLGKMLDKAKNTGKPYPYLRNTNVQWGRFELDDIKHIHLEMSELDEFRLHPGDLLICEGGEPGRCAIWGGATDAMYFQKALHRVRPFSGVRSGFLALCLEADARAGSLDRHFTGATIKHFVGQALERYVVPLPPLAEQSRIVARVEELRSLCTDLRQRLAANRHTQAQLAEALIASATL
ncbi:restriction endonuclease subunit S [Variovorax sp. J22G21]|uniref:restriction endonuclease subunit S n=1 Tax=Variovorax fucosicus TaxID=3053517 RepID=UPI002575C7D1|nr:MULTISPECIES: restriction endonuclease subunit S [unclassified Variovorax]MDM0039115.1 restriction endonuclease subunit S [Variovorax sp. J22R193]MDM0063891.1 restriction endonuclease subunit S [Variovorax sp. J22G21]